LRDALFGSIALQVIREVTVPVVFVRPDHAKDQRTPPVRRVLLPLDGSEAHEVAIPVAASVAAKCGAEIRLLTVVPTTQTLPVKEAIASRVSPRATALTLDISAQQAEEYLRRKSADLSAQGLAVSGEVARGDALSKLTETIAVENVDMVVMATHGHSAIDAHWEGSLTPRFLPQTPVPVILVRGIGNKNE
jgi:nucleotide-binding universal stress UspA family protein